MSVRRASQKGLTLIELLITVAILAIVGVGLTVAYDGVQKRAGEQLTLRRLSYVREALLNFRRDLGYFPGQGPLAAEQLDLASIHFVDGDNPGQANPSLEARQRWARHPLNFWMLLTPPVDQNNPQRWQWRKEISRGWNGPYLGQELNFRLDAAGQIEGNFVVGSRSNRLLAVADSYIPPNTDSTNYLQWVEEDQPLTSSVPPTKINRNRIGQALAFYADDSTTPAIRIYWLVSAGLDGVFQLVGPNFGDDVRVEVARESI